MYLMGKKAKEKMETTLSLSAMTEKIHNTYFDILELSNYPGNSSL